MKYRYIHVFVFTANEDKNNGNKHLQAFEDTQNT